VPAPREAAFREILAVTRDGPAPLDPAPPGASRRERLHFAFVIPPFRRGSGGHGTIFQLLSRLERRGHLCSVWIHDARRETENPPPAVARRQICEWFTPVDAPVFAGLSEWHGADVAIATGWDTVHAAALVPARARAYLVQDHEPEFFATSAERMWAEATYTLGFHPICAGHWLRDLVARRYGPEGSWFGLGVDHDLYHPGTGRRNPDEVVFYARKATPRRAVSLGVLALAELASRRPTLHVVAFGEPRPPAMPFSAESVGIESPAGLARRYRAGSAGLCLSLTNYSLIPQEMMACGLPPVDLAGGSSEAMFGTDGPVTLADAEPSAIADAVERLLQDRDLWLERSRAGIEHGASASWDAAARQLEEGLRHALELREGADGG
jgi:O-antigen biosynthesis protein